MTLSDLSLYVVCLQWKNASPEQIMTSNKMRCVFEMPADSQEDPMSRVRIARRASPPSRPLGMTPHVYQRAQLADTPAGLADGCRQPSVPVVRTRTIMDACVDVYH